MRSYRKQLSRLCQAGDDQSLDGLCPRDFLIRIDVDTGGREYATFNAQMRALAACRMTLGFVATTIDAKPI
jgi:hypothetical protein